MTSALTHGTVAQGERRQAPRGALRPQGPRSVAGMTAMPSGRRYAWCPVVITASSLLPMTAPLGLDNAP